VLVWVCFATIPDSQNATLFASRHVQASPMVRSKLATFPPEPLVFVLGVALVHMALVTVAIQTMQTEAVQVFDLVGLRKVSPLLVAISL